MNLLYFIYAIIGLSFLNFSTTHSSEISNKQEFHESIANVANRWKRQGFQFNGNGEEDTSSDSPGCIIHCLTIIAKGAIMIGKQNGTSQNPMESGSSLLCTKYDEHGLDEVCKSYVDGMKCFESCGDSAMKNITLNGFTSLQFICIDRRKDFDKNLPCIGDSCSASEQLCKPTCGLIQKGTKENLTFSLEQLGSASSASDFMNLDLFGIQKTVAENCRYASCYMNCSRPSLTAKCGELAYSLYEELIWKLISAATHSFQDIGLGSVWPEECKIFTAIYDVQHEVSTTAIIDTGVKNQTAYVPSEITTTPSCKNATCGNGNGSGSAAAVIPSLSILFVAILSLNWISRQH